MLSWKIKNIMKLKRICSIGGALLLFMFASFRSSEAQSIVKKAHIQYGATIGAHYSVITGYSGGSGRIGPDIGGFMQIPIQSQNGLYNYKPVHFYIVPQIDFSMMGETDQSGEETIKHHFNYIEIPVYAKYYIKGFNIIKGDKLFAMAGPVFGFLASENIGEKDPQYREIQDNANDLNLGVSVVGGYALPEHLEGFVRIDKGFTNLFGESKTLDKAYNVKIGVGINWIFE